mmetsp:Transcript_24655/g.77302  ORF Transcript_24655/g.77302 Transcript_24655/m.77302 type:complete len:84 (+) Transcript_24655:117-368(+)
MSDAFEVLHVPRGASEAEIRKAFKQRALALHPDRSTGDTEAFQALNAALETALKATADGTAGGAGAEEMHIAGVLRLGEDLRW